MPGKSQCFVFVLQGVVAPHSVCEVPLQIRAQCLEEQEMPCFIAIFGSPDPPLVSVHCVRDMGSVLGCMLLFAYVEVFFDSHERKCESSWLACQILSYCNFLKYCNYDKCQPLHDSIIHVKLHSCIPLSVTLLHISRSQHNQTGIKVQSFCAFLSSPVGTFVCFFKRIVEYAFNASSFFFSFLTGEITDTLFRRTITFVFSFSHTFSVKLLLEERKIKDGWNLEVKVPQR